MDLKRFFKTLPFVLALLVIPITMRMVEVNIPFEVQLHWKGASVDQDIFNYSKSVLLIISAVIVALTIFFTISDENFIKIKSLKPFVIAFAILVIMSIISTILGGNGVITYGGAPSRYEGLYSYIGYFILFFYAMMLYYDKTTHHMIIIILSMFTIICAVVGFSQYIGKDIFLTKFATALYIPESLKQYRDSMTVTQFSFKNMYIFTTHYNYASMLMSMLSMFWSIYFLCSKERAYKIISAFMSVLAIAMLIGANARSGIVAVVIGIFILLLTFASSKTVSKKKLLIVAIVFALFLGAVVKVGLLPRFNSLVEDIKKIGSSVEDNNYMRSQIPLKDIILDDNSYTVVYENATLKFDKKSNSFYDENNNMIAFQTLSQGKISFIDEKYSAWSVETLKRKSNLDESERLYHVVRINNYAFNFDVTDSVKLVNHLGIEIHPESAERIGLKGMERLGSGRGFIISSTVPLIIKSPIIGYGPDAFLQIFNQDDIYAKMYVYDDPMHIVDKPHNLFLLFAVNFGLIGLFAFLYIIILLIIKTAKKYKTESISQNALYIASFAGAITYIASGLFNDSTLSVSTIFWVFLGIAISGLYSNSQKIK